MPTASREETIVVNGIPFGSALSETEDGGGNREIALPVGSEATSWVKTDADTAACDVATASTIATGKVDVWWDVGVRYGVDCVRTVDALALDGGEGDDFPESAEDTCIVTQQVEIDFPVDGDNLVAIAISCDQAAHLDFQESDDTSIYTLSLEADATWSWFLSSGNTNNLAGDPCGKILASNSSATTAATLKIAYAYDATP
jgi:hypothetical protein